MVGVEVSEEDDEDEAGTRGTGVMVRGGSAAEMVAVEEEKDED